MLERYLENDKKFDSVCLLQPTSPLRDANDIVLAYRLLEERKGDSVTSVCEVDHSPLWSMKLPEDLSLNEFNKECEDIPRQRLGKYYRLNGAIYIRKIQYKDNSINLLNQDDYALIMDRKHSVDIDTIEDFELAEWYMSKR